MHLCFLLLLCIEFVCFRASEITKAVSWVPRKISLYTIIIICGPKTRKTFLNPTEHSKKTQTWMILYQFKQNFPLGKVVICFETKLHMSGHYICNKRVVNMLAVFGSFYLFHIKYNIHITHVRFYVEDRGNGERESKSKRRRYQVKLHVNTWLHFESFIIEMGMSTEIAFMCVI